MQPGLAMLLKSTSSGCHNVRFYAQAYAYLTTLQTRIYANNPGKCSSALTAMTASIAHTAVTATTAKDANIPRT